jgi:hypothetical protein
LGESITTARHGLTILSTHSSGPSEIKFWDFLYSEWGDYHLFINILGCKFKNGRA